MLDVNSMRKYLCNACELERYVYIWNNALTSVNNSIRDISQKKQATQSAIVSKEIEFSRIENDVLAERKEEKHDAKTLGGCVIPIGILFIALCYCMPFLLGVFEEIQSYDNVSFAEALKRYINKDLGFAGVIAIIIAAIAIISGLIGVIISMVKNFITKEKLGFWEKETQRRKQRIDKDKQQLYMAITSFTNSEKLLLEEKNKIILNLRKAKEALSLLYSKNVLPIKYRNFTAVTTMFEYLATGRCTAIEGHGGIIDTYENDYKLGIIINNLIEINQKMDIIAANQQMLYQELNTANSHLQKIEMNIKAIETHTSKIEKNTAISAVANQQTAAIARSMEWQTWANGF